jgi:tetratricopeptide (TPR) repeat protein
MRLARIVLVIAALLIGQAAFAISVEEIITLSRLGIAEAEIIRAVEKEQTIFNLAIQDIMNLKKAGVKEKVIRYMMRTPELFKATGAPAAAGAAPGAAGAPSTAPEVEKPMTLEERRAEEERVKQESLKLAEERKRAEEAKQKAFAQGQLGAGMEAVEDGRWVTAVNTFLKFMKDGNFGPGTDEYYTAKYGIASAFMAAGLYHSAGKFLMEVLSEGPDKRFFQEAFNDLRELRQHVDFAPPTLEELTKHYVGGFSTAFQHSYYYFLGKFFYDYSNFPMAIKYMQMVSEETSPYYPRAKYVIGLVQVTNAMYRSALKSFQQAILAAEDYGDELSDIADLGYLALARIGYENGEYDAAIYYYRKIPKRSRLLRVAFYESAWTYFLKGDYSRALGTFHALQSPFFSKTFYPEMWILEATVFLNMCHYERSKEALQMFRNEVLALGEPLKRFLGSVRMPADYYRSFVSAVNGEETDIPLPAKLSYPVLADPEFYDLYRTVRTLDQEIAEVEGNLDELDSFGKDLLMKLQATRMGKINEIGIKIQQILSGVLKDITDYQIKVTEIEVDLGGVEIAKLDEKTREIMERQEKDRAKQQLQTFLRRGGTPEQIQQFIERTFIFKKFKARDLVELEEAGVTEDVTDRIRALTATGTEERGTLAIVGSDALMWPWEGDFWLDEVGSYRSFLKEVCAK